MSSVTIKVLSTVNAPYGTNLSAEQLASKISDIASVESFDASAFAFYSEVNGDLQHQFLNEMGIDHEAASEIAQKFSQLAGYPLALAQVLPDNAWLYPAVGLRTAAKRKFARAQLGD